MEFHARNGLRPVINVSGTMTSLGASSAIPEVVQAMTEILPHFVEIGDLQRHASQVIAQVCGSEAGFITASCSAAITLSVAACMTGENLASIEQLPCVDGLKNEIVIQTGHLVNYGAPVDQAIRLAGANLLTVGQATEAYAHQLNGAITDRTAAAVYVVSHHTVSFGLIPFETFVEVAHSRGVPVIVDAASEYDLRGFIARGADVALYSAHKFLQGPTAGIVAGQKNLVKAAYLQNYGIGRGMKVGKESIYGALTALNAWQRRDHIAIAEREDQALQLWKNGLSQLPGVRATVSADPTGNPLNRLRIDIDAKESHITAWDLVDKLAEEPEPIIARDHEVELGFFFLDPCNLKSGDAETVLCAILRILASARTHPVQPSSIAERNLKRIQGKLNWPD